MEEIVKHINDTNASYRTIGAGDAKNTDLFLDNEHFQLFKYEGEQITVRFNKENLQKAILFIASILPRKYDNSATHKTIPFSTAFVYDQMALLDAFFMIEDEVVETRTQIWNARKDVLKKNGEIDNRFYFNGLLEEVAYKNHQGEINTAKFTIRNYLAGGYSDLHIKKGDDGIFDVWVTNVIEPYYDGEEKVFENHNTNLNLPLQQIFYGAPGTGKSHTINEITEQQPKENVFRTTFHPDSDYSTFVGCYKPTMISKEPLYKVGELINKLSEIKTSGATYPCHKFAAKYWESLKDLSADEVKKILTACGFTESMAVETGKGIAIGEDFAKKTDNKKIVYSFVPQSFTKAYLRAWQTTEPVYLVIEEINRGNCAQIFGDLFQLLDRKCDGFSEYPIKADNDLATYIAENLSSSTRTDIPDSVRSGEELSLPANLYIWATMNTSDQSLFPIDSAFKRRWDWKYVPIDAKKESWSINADGTNYDWSDFLEKINAKIESATSSEDKMLGFYFCKAENNIVSAERFVNKVLFYLWNDVFRDYGFDDAVFNDENNKKITFRMFYQADGKVDEAIVKKFLDNLGVNIKDNEEIIEIDDIDETNPAVANKNHLKNITFADGTVFSTNDMGPFDAYIEAIKKIGVDNVYSIADKLKYRRLNHPLISKEKYPEIENSTSYSYMQLGEYYFVKGSKTYTLVRMLEDIKNLLSIDMTINC